MPEDTQFLPDRRIMESFDAVKRTTKKGVQYWRARELQLLLGYEKWENFSEAIHRARRACESTGTEPSHHFADIKKMMALGKGAKREVPDVALTRYGAYLTAMNGDPSKPEIAAAQAYFATQARRQEMADQQADVKKRIALRDRVKNANKYLASAAKNAGVQNFPLFQDAGYRGLYDMSLAQLKEHKGLNPRE